MQKLITKKLYNTLNESAQLELITTIKVKINDDNNFIYEIVTKIEKKLGRQH